MGETSLTLVKRINASPQRVYESCTDPSLVAQWFSPERLDVEEIEIDLRIGGRFGVRMAGAEGVYAVEGRYVDIQQAKRLSMTWMWRETPPGVDLGQGSSLVTFSFEPDGGGTQLTLVHERIRSEVIAADHREGWTEAFIKLERLLGKQLASQ